MKKKIFYSLLALVLLFGITGCGSKKEETKEEKNKSVLKTDVIKIDGAYIDESFDDKDLDLLFLFYTYDAGDANLEMASSSITIKINDNEYKSTESYDYVPKYTEYSYGTIIRKIYVGKTYKMLTTFKVPKGDLEGDKFITIDSYKISSTPRLNGLKDIKIYVADVKRMESLDKISEDLDKSVFTKRYDEEQEKLADADAATVNKVKKAINGYIISQYVNVGSTIKTIQFEFAAPNKFKVSLAGLNNSGTYTVKKGYIALDYGSGPHRFLAYNFDKGDISFTNINDQFGTLTDYDPLGEE